jgi:hypothetical protein
MADSLQSTTPVTALGGMPGRRGAEPQPKAGGRRPEPPEPPPTPPPSGDQVRVTASAVVARRVLRERVLARTRQALELGAIGSGPEFAEVIDDESTAAFLGRLLSAQNQLAGLRAPSWPGPRLRAALDRGLREGAEEALGLLGVDGQGEAEADAAAVAVVADVLAEYGRRLAALPPDA